jgi:hypothetical protein
MPVLEQFDVETLAHHSRFQRKKICLGGSTTLKVAPVGLVEISCLILFQITICEIDLKWGSGN